MGKEIPKKTSGNTATPMLTAATIPQSNPSGNQPAILMMDMIDT
jgi:hypothetical protein